MKKLKKLVLGRTDKADFPEFDLLDIDVKVDTGAYTSTLHCHSIQEVSSDFGNGIQFCVLDPEHQKFNNVQIISYTYELKDIKSSNGITEKRYVINSSIILYGNTYIIDLTLADRRNMRYPILLGRSILKKNFLIDVAKKDLSYKKKLKQCG